jgi:modulator of FtsH protease
MEFEMQDRSVSTAAKQQMAGIESSASLLETHKVLRNTYMLLGLTLLVTALASAVSIFIQLSHTVSLISLIAAFVMLFVVHKTADSAKGLPMIFIFSALMGISLGPMLSHYLSLTAGPSLVFQAFAGTALIFFSLSAYVLTTKKDFSFMGGFLFVGLVLVIIAMIANWFFAIPALSLALSSIVILLMSGFILFDTSRIIHGGETNYIRATVGLYLNIYNIFVHLLHLLGAAGDD